MIWDQDAASGKKTENKQPEPSFGSKVSGKKRPKTDTMVLSLFGELSSAPEYFVVLDVETRLSAREVGGWHRAERMGVSVAVLYDSRQDAFFSYSQEEVPRLAEALAAAPLVVGFNLLRFDYNVLAPHAPGFDFRSLLTLDMLLKVQERLSYRVSLNNLASATLGSQKSADGLQALKWWKQKRLDLIEAYCRKDVALTRDLYLHGREHGYLLSTNKAGQRMRVLADWRDNFPPQNKGQGQ